MVSRFRRLFYVVCLTGEAEDVRACARVSPDKVRGKLTLPLACPLATPLSLLKRAKTDNKLHALLLPFFRAERGVAGKEELAEVGRARLLGFCVE